MKVLTIAKAGPMELCTRFNAPNAQEVLNSADELKALPEGIAYAEVYVKVADLIRDNGNGRLVLDDIRIVDLS